MKAKMKSASKKMTMAKPKKGAAKAKAADMPMETTSAPMMKKGGKVKSYMKGGKTKC